MNLDLYFQTAIDRGASDLHLVEGSVPSIRVFGELVKLNEPPIPFGELRYAIYGRLDKSVKERLERQHDLDLSLDFQDNRFRLNIHYQEGKIGMAARRVPKRIPIPQEIEFTETLYNLTHLKDGLILVTGPSGTGKSTTLAVMIDLINTERHSHIITIEDPIEYLFEEKLSIVEQRQLGRDTESFSSALRNALRQDPNVIMVGEMRDLETINAAMMAVNTGHLVLSTLHTTTAPETVERILDFYSSENRPMIAGELAVGLRAVICQQLLPSKEGGLVVAREIMVNNSAIGNLIRTGHLDQLHTVIQTGGDDGMITMNKAIERLFHQGRITEEVANRRMRDMNTRASYY